MAYPETLLPEPFNARDRVHEYGGAAFAVFDGVIYFTNYADQRIYRFTAGQSPEALTTIDDVRHADFACDKRFNRLIAVREDTLDGGPEPRNAIAAVSLAGDRVGESTLLIEGCDLLESARQPGWQCSPLVAVEPPQHAVGRYRTVDWPLRQQRYGCRPNADCGGTSRVDLSTGMVTGWHVFFVSDRTGWWNIYHLTGGEQVNLTPETTEYGAPAWLLGAATYAVDGQGRLLTTSSRQGVGGLELLDPKSGERTPFDLPSTEISKVVARNNIAMAIVASPREASTVVAIDLQQRSVSILQHSVDIDIANGYISVPGAITFPTSDGQIAHAFSILPRIVTTMLQPANFHL
ncbi:MAG: hypothetical protein R2839_05590 [Thermomicrobiales bacterium]